MMARHTQRFAIEYFECAIRHNIGVIVTKKVSMAGNNGLRTISQKKSRRSQSVDLGCFNSGYGLVGETVSD